MAGYSYNERQRRNLAEICRTRPKMKGRRGFRTVVRQLSHVLNAWSDAREG